MQQQNCGNLYNLGAGGSVVDGSTLTFPEVSQILPWAIPSGHSFDPVHDPFLLNHTPPAQPQSFHQRAAGLQCLGYDGSFSDHNMRLLSESDHLGQMVRPKFVPFVLHPELQKMTAQEIMDAKAIAASRSHSEAERRRRERINGHLAKLRSLLPNTIKTDKASLLAEVVQQVKELKRQTSLIAESSPVPAETDELIIDGASDEDGKLLIKASICCQDRTDLLPDVINALKALKLKTLKAEITTLGGRVKNVLFITADDQSADNEQQHQQQRQESWMSSIKEALAEVMKKCNGEESSGSGCVKRQRTYVNMLERRLL